MCLLKQSPTPTPIEQGGTYAHSPSPEPPYLRKRIYTPPPLSRVLVTIGNYKKKPLSVLSLEIFLRLLPNNTPFPEKMGIRMRPPHAFDWGGGGWEQLKLNISACKVSFYIQNNKKVYQISDKDRNFSTTISQQVPWNLVPLHKFLVQYSHKKVQKLKFDW